MNLSLSLTALVMPVTSIFSNPVTIRYQIISILLLFAICLTPGCLYDAIFSEQLSNHCPD